ncbi:MAG: 50S ribosomal protein L9, partial [Microbacteriaceae bacterium]|nr:50S ribosomal protein L9 [Microbacteriaceae bacterium]
DVVAAIEAAGIKGVDKRSIDIPAPIKSTGEAEAVIALHAGVVAKVTLAVVAEK